MGLFDSFEALNFPLYHGNSSVWGGTGILHASFVEGVDGHGWHIDRPQFESWLRDVAARRGARLLTPANVVRASREGEGFAVDVRTPEGLCTIGADFVIDAGGRQSLFTRSLGAQVSHDSSLICRAVYGCSTMHGPGTGITFVEAVKDGWWYTAPLPEGRRILAFHTDSDIEASTRVRAVDDLMREARNTTIFHEILNPHNFLPEGPCYVRAANGSVLDRHELGWLAVGDAALTFDPLSSQGLLNALFMGLASAEAADSYLGGDEAAISCYTSLTGGIRSAYCVALREAYGRERRWPHSIFWKRRH
jgi:flavin-dependent dehydrogenase